MDKIVENFKNIPTTCVSDVSKGLNNLDASIKPLKESYKLVGRAFTVKMPVGDNLIVLKAIQNASVGDVIIIDTKGNDYRAIAGDFICGIAKTLGIAGIVVDGVIRDIQGIKDLDYPVFCKGTTVAASEKNGVGEMNKPISCGGVSIKSGDIVIGDADGVVIVAQERENEIYEKSLEKIKKDELREKEFSGDVNKVKKYLENIIATNTTK